MIASQYNLNKQNFEEERKRQKESGGIYKDKDIAAYLHMTKNNFSVIKNNHIACQEIYLRQIGELWGVNWKWLAGVSEYRDPEKELMMNEMQEAFTNREEVLLKFFDYLGYRLTRLEPDLYQVTFLHSDGHAVKEMEVSRSKIIETFNAVCSSASSIIFSLLNDDLFKRTISIDQHGRFIELADHGIVPTWRTEDIEERTLSVFPEDKEE